MPVPTAAERESDLLVVMALPEGRRFLLTLLQQCCHNGTTFNESHAKASFNEGRRSVAVEVERRMKNADFNRWLQVMTIERQETQSG